MPEEALDLHRCGMTLGVIVTPLAHPQVHTVITMIDDMNVPARVTRLVKHLRDCIKACACIACHNAANDVS